MVLENIIGKMYMKMMHHIGGPVGLRDHKVKSKWVVICKIMQYITFSFFFLGV